ASQAAIAIDNARLYEETREAQEKLRRQLHFTSAITTSLGEGLFAVDRSGRVSFINPAAEKLLGWRQDEVIGQRVDETIFRPPANDASAALDDVLQGEKMVRQDDC